MTLIQCKVCGQTIEHNEDRAYGSCPHCGSAMTLPRGADAERIRLFNQANSLRLAGEYEQAMSVCERLLASDHLDAEAHWYMVLCRYGVQYGREGASGAERLTCRRENGESIHYDPDFHKALEYVADSQARETYRNEGAMIADAQQSTRIISPNPERGDWTGDRALLASNQQHSGQVSSSQSPSAPSVASFVRRAQLFLEDGNFRRADEYAEKALDIDPECATAYLTKLQARLQVQQEFELGEGKEPLEHDADFQKALRYADPAQKQVYQGYNERIMKRLESNHKENAYQAALQQAQTARSEAEYRKAAEAFRALSGVPGRREA